ncbi:MAG: DUF1549 domain-containing protein [Acidobacteria bacterium]|nr:DUF1549 domain-containing protein [Acidobacteriota bacterium]
MKNTFVAVAAGLLVLGGVSTFAQEEQVAATETVALGVEHSECSLMGPERVRFLQSGLAAQKRKEYEFSRVTSEVIRLLPKLATTGRIVREAASNNVIDKHLTKVWSDNGVTPAKLSDDYEFLRRVTLDLTGRIPTAEKVQSFVADQGGDKRARMVEELLSSEAFVEKWAVFFGDLLKNTVSTTQFNRYPSGRDAFANWIKDSLRANKSYKDIASELIAAAGEHSYTQGELNWIVGGFVTGGPAQDYWDQMAVNTTTTFLGINATNCLECHNGRGHLTGISLWGETATRFQAWQLSSFFSKIQMDRLRVDPNQPNGNPYYWRVRDLPNRADYTLGSTTGNRPARTPVGTLRVVAPAYLDGSTPRPGENYRAALARMVTSDPQFARAAVNYIWKQFMVKAFVEPVDQFDLARLDPDNPPPDPWTLQPNQPRLLNDLAASFASSGFNIRTLMKTIVTSDAYQLSSRYEGTWNPAYEDMYARHLARRLWAEEIHDAVAQSSKVPAAYRIGDAAGTIVDRAMKFNDVRGLPQGNGAMVSWLDSFLRGNRDNEQRRSDGSPLQVLNLMNDTFVMSRTRATGTGATASLARVALSNTTDDQLIDILYLNVLSRLPGDDERRVATAHLRSGNRQTAAEDLLWALYNKVDFIFNY